MSYFPVGFVNPIPKTEISYIGENSSGTDVTVGNSYTFSSQAIGAADGNRWVILALGMKPITATQSAVTIGGIAATQIASETTANGGIYFYAAHVPSGTTANIVVTVSGATAARCYVNIYRMLTRYLPTSPYATASDNTLTSGHNDVTIDVPKDGVCLADAISTVGSSPGINWTGLTEDDQTPAPDATTTQIFGCAGGTNTFASAQTAFAIRATHITTPSAGVLLAVSFK